MRQLLLIRHPAPAGAAGLCYGRTDLPLADAERDIALIVTRLRDRRVGQVWSSPATRCRIVADAIAASPVIDERLQELHFGAWEGLAWDAVPRDALDRWAQDPMHRAPPGGETGHALIARVTRAYGDLRAQPCGVAVIGHAGPLKILAALAAGREPDLFAPSLPFGELHAAEIADAAQE